MQATIGKPSSGSGMHRASRRSLLVSQWHPQHLAAVGLPKRQTLPQAAGSNQDLWMLAGPRCAPAMGMYPSACYLSKEDHVCCLCIITTSTVLALWQATILPGAEVMGPCSKTHEPGRSIVILLVRSPEVGNAFYEDGGKEPDTWPWLHWALRQLHIKAGPTPSCRDLPCAKWQGVQWAALS